MELDISGRVGAGIALLAAAVGAFAAPAPTVAQPRATAVSPRQTVSATVTVAVRLLGGAPGRGATLARRDGARWFVGSLSATGPRTRRVPLRFLARGRRYRARIWSDGPGGRIAVAEPTVTAAGTLRVPAARNGGFAIMLSPG